MSSPPIFSAGAVRHLRKGTDSVLFHLLQRRRFNFNFQPPAPRHRFNVEVSGGGRNHRNFNVGGSVHGQYDLYRSRGGTRVVASGGVAHGVTRIDGKTYKGRPQGSVGIGVEIPIGKGR
ncbi:uncharacterized protein LOC119403001 [Rhipicephalus sanguineus]|uniref:uncharacterized protein LOC119403001 n=1 Tax=Rhipicephalus sanguineus TaxID=34632 RepID=UPI0020C31108|nr:uncharacterized protein LOC119403001 [Rhipicephalus sanguineus]